MAVNSCVSEAHSYTYHFGVEVLGVNDRLDILVIRIHSQH